MPVLRAVTLEEAKAAQVLLKTSVSRSPLVKLIHDVPGLEELEIYLKLENLQPTSSFKIRGAGNAVASKDLALLKKHGVVTCSAGNFAQGLAFNAGKLGVPALVVMPDTAAPSKRESVKKLGGTVEVVSYEAWWAMIKAAKHPISPALFIHPVCEQEVLAGNSTIALEILEDLPDVDAVLVPWGGGGLGCGIGSVMKALKPSCRVLAVEPETAAPLAWSFQHKSRCELFPLFEPTFVDGCGGKAILEDMWPLAQQVIDGSIVVPLRDILDAIRVVLLQNKLLIEGAAACSVAAAIGKFSVIGNQRKGQQVPVKGRVVCVLSGGGLDGRKLRQILAECPRSGSPRTESACPRSRPSCL